MECIFCKIVRGEIPATKVLEDQLNLAFLDIRPRSPGHTLVIPKKHYEKLEDMSQQEAKELFGFIHKLIKVVTRAVNAQGYNLGINNGKVAGQEVMHVHFNIIPRFHDDKGLPIQGIVQIEVKEDLNEIANKIKQKISELGLDKEKTKEEKPSKTSEREWQEFVLEEQDKAPNYSEARRE